MDRLHAMTVFMAVADAGSFSKAAEQLRLSPFTPPPVPVQIVYPQGRALPDFVSPRLEKRLGKEQVPRPPPL